MSSFFFFTDPATTEIYTLSLHDALPISSSTRPHSPPGWRRDVRSSPASPTPRAASPARTARTQHERRRPDRRLDRKSTRLNSSHSQISYAVFCLKKKKQKTTNKKEPAN